MFHKIVYLKFVLQSKCTGKKLLREPASKGTARCIEGHINCMPRGSPLAGSGTGTDMLGIPARLAGTVKRSSVYPHDGLFLKIGNRRRHSCSRE